MTEKLKINWTQKKSEQPGKYLYRLDENSPVFLLELFDVYEANSCLLCVLGYDFDVDEMVGEWSEEIKEATPPAIVAEEKINMDEICCGDFEILLKYCEMPFLISLAKKLGMTHQEKRADLIHKIIYKCDGVKFEKLNMFLTLKD